MKKLIKSLYKPQTPKRRYTGVKALVPAMDGGIVQIKQ